MSRRFGHPLPRLSRRALLGGAAAAIGLPWLEAMLPTGRRARADVGGTCPLRAVWFYVPNGMHMPAWTPAAEGPDFELPEILRPLAAVRDEVLVLSGLDNRPAIVPVAGDHARGTGSFLTCTTVKKTDGADIENGISVDQVAAQALGGATPFPSLQLGIDGGGSTGGCDSGYSCAYTRNISWAGPATPLPKMSNPQAIFDRLFGGFDPELTADAIARRRLFRLSVLDSVAEDTARLQARLGAADRAKLDEYLTGLRALELRIDSAAEQAQCDPGARPEGGLDHLDRVIALNELIVLALRCDATRLITHMFGNAASNRAFPFLGVSDGHHSLSHHQNDPANHARLVTIGTWEVAQFADLLERLQRVPEADGTLLDNCLVYFSSEIADGNSHRHTGLPVLLAGRAGGAIDPGRHLVYDGVPMANLFLSMLELLGVPRASFGDSTGPLGGLSA